MKPFISVAFFLASFVLAPVQAATGDEERVAALQALTGYLAANVALDPKQVVSYYHELFMLVSTGRTTSFATREDLERWVESNQASLRARGYGRGEWPQLQMSLLSSGTAIASVLIVRYKTDGQELERFGATYVLRKVGNGWKVAVLVAHDPSTVLKLE
jgi:ketosteroid isomerase-like protein